MQETQNTPLDKTDSRALITLINIKLMERRRRDYIASIFLAIVAAIFLYRYAYFIFNPTYSTVVIGYSSYWPIILLVTLVMLIVAGAVDIVYTNKNLQHLQRSYLSYNKIYIKICKISMLLDIFVIIFSIIRIVNPFAWLLYPARQMEYLTGGMNAVMSMGISAVLIKNASKLDVYLQEYFELIDKESNDLNGQYAPTNQAARQ